MVLMLKYYSSRDKGRRFEKTGYFICPNTEGQRSTLQQGRDTQSQPPTILPLAAARPGNQPTAASIEDCRLCCFGAPRLRHLAESASYLDVGAILVEL